MKKIKSYLKLNYKKLVIQVISIISALVLFTVPVFASEYSANWIVDVQKGENGFKYGGIYFRYWNSTGGKYHYTVDVHTYPDIVFYGCPVPKEYNTVAALFKKPLGSHNSLAEALNVEFIREKIYLEFSFRAEILTGEGVINGPFEFYLAQVDFLTDEGFSKKYSYEFDIQSQKWNNTLQYQEFNIGVTILPSEPIRDFDVVNFNFYVVNPQNNDYEFFVAPLGPIKIKTGDDIPKYAPIASNKIDNLDSVEQELQDKTQVGINEAGKIFNNAGNVFGKTNVVGTSVMAATKIFNSLLKTDVFNDILDVALVLGIFAFLLGLGGVGASLWNKHDRNSSRNKEKGD